MPVAMTEPALTVHIAWPMWYKLAQRGPCRQPRRDRLFACGWKSPRLAKEQEDRIIVQVIVRDNNVDQALRALKKKMQREGIFREMKLRRAYEKPSEKRAREKAEAVRRARKLARKRMEREGF